MPGVWATVTNSQVFNWVKLIHDKGIRTDCLSISDIKPTKDEILEIENIIGGKFYTASRYGFMISDVYLFFVLLGLYFRSVFKYDKIIFQTRLPKIAIPFVLIGMLYKVKIIYEARGAITEERSHVTRNRKNKGFKFKIKTAFINLNERLFMKLSDQVICVSNALKYYYIKKYKLSNIKKFNVFPGAADNSMFYHDFSHRDKIRKDLNFTDDDIVIIYSGKLAKDWEIPDDVFSFMSILMSKNKRIKFLVLTPDLEISNQYIQKYSMEGSTQVLKSKFEDVNNYLNAADISLLLREDVPMNNVASPTKFSEYMLAGIPCIMSNGVYDFANIIRDTGYGIVLIDYHKLEEKEYNQILNLLKLDRAEISDFGREVLSKEKLISRYYQLLKNV